MEKAPFNRSSIGRKTIVAVTGLLLVGFLIGHLAGNLQVYAGGPDLINAYAYKLKSLGPILWAIRAGLFLVAFLHIYSTVKLWQENQAARPVAYQYPRQYRRASWASRWMILSGAIVLGFIVFHLAHFTLGWVDTSYMTLVDENGHHDVYTMMILGFRNPSIVGFYLVAQTLLFYHLAHGVASLLVTLGLTSTAVQKRARPIVNLFSILLCVGFASMPVAIFLRLIGQEVP